MNIFKNHYQIEKGQYYFRYVGHFIVALVTIAIFKYIFGLNDDDAIKALLATYLFDTAFHMKLIYENTNTY